MQTLQPKCQPGKWQNQDQNQACLTYWVLLSWHHLMSARIYFSSAQESPAGPRRVKVGDRVCGWDKGRKATMEDWVRDNKTEVQSWYQHQEGKPMTANYGISTFRENPESVSRRYWTAHLQPQYQAKETKAKAACWYDQLQPSHCHVQPVHILLTWAITRPVMATKQ